MLRVNQLIGFGALTLSGVAPPEALSITHLPVLTSTTSSATQTFSSVAIGAAASNRDIVLQIAWRGSSGSLSTVTIGGVSATRSSRGTASATGNNAEVWYARVPSGTTATIVTVNSATVTEMIIEPVRLTGFTGTPEDSDGTTGTGTLSLDGAGACLALGVWSNVVATASPWLNGVFDNAQEANLGGGLSASFGQRKYPAAISAVNARCVDSGVGQRRAAVVWPLPSFEADICNIYSQFTDGTDQTTVTTGSLSIGEDTVDRMVVVGFAWSAAASRTISSVTIGGVSATAVTSNATASGGTAIYKATGVTGTSAVVVITFSSTVTRCGGTVYRTTPASTTEVDAVSNGLSAQNCPVNDVSCSAGGFVIMVGREASSSTTVTATWSGVDPILLDTVQLVETLQVRAGYILTSETQTTNDINYNTNTANAKNASVASWL